MIQNRRNRRKSAALLVFLIPGILLFLVFRYVPLAFMSISFQDYNIFEGFANSEWVGLKHFKAMFESPEFYQIFFNTMIITFLKLIFVFTAPLVFAILLNEVGKIWLKKTIQTLVFIPHFLSWVVISGIFFSIFGGEGIVNQILFALGQEKIFFFVDKKVFRALLLITEIWKSTGWRAILYLAAISAIDPQLYEAAIIDGANRIQQIFRITLPSLVPTIFTVLLLYIGYVMTANFEQIIVLYNPQVYEVADILQTNVYRRGLGQLELSYGAAVGIFNSAIVFLLAVFTNRMARRFSERSIW